MSQTSILLLKSRYTIAVVCLLLGALLVLGYRFVTFQVETVHYHANFALYINGVKEEFASEQYYSDVEMCRLNDTITPSDRAHMHDKVNNVVHVEDHAVSWGQFFSNLGWSMGPNYLVSRTGTFYAEGGDNKLNLILNGKDYTDLGGLQNTLIKDTDKLLISYGVADRTTLKQQFSTVPETASKYDTKKDPASCSGNHTTTTKDRLNHLL